MHTCKLIEMWLELGKVFVSLGDQLDEGSSVSLLLLGEVLLSALSRELCERSIDVPAVGNVIVLRALSSIQSIAVS